MAGGRVSGETSPDWCDDIACAATATVASEPCKSNERADKADVKEDGNECKETDAAKETSQDDGKDGE